MMVEDSVIFGHFAEHAQPEADTLESVFNRIHLETEHAKNSKQALKATSQKLTPYRKRLTPQS